MSSGCSRTASAKIMNIIWKQRSPRPHDIEIEPACCAQGRRHDDKVGTKTAARDRHDQSGGAEHGLKISTRDPGVRRRRIRRFRAGAAYASMRTMRLADGRTRSTIGHC